MRDSMFVHGILATIVDNEWSEDTFKQSDEYRSDVSEFHACEKRKHNVETLDKKTRDTPG